MYLHFGHSRDVTTGLFQWQSLHTHVRYEWERTVHTHFFTKMCFRGLHRYGKRYHSLSCVWFPLLVWALSWSLRSRMLLQNLCDSVNNIVCVRDEIVLNSGSLVLYRYTLVNPHRLCPLCCYVVGRMLENNPQLREDIQAGKLHYQPAPKNWQVICFVNRPFTQIRSSWMKDIPLSRKTTWSVADAKELLHLSVERTFSRD
jgi:hypothetical protein